MSDPLRESWLKLWREVKSSGGWPYSMPVGPYRSIGIFDCCEAWRPRQTGHHLKSLKHFKAWCLANMDNAISNLGREHPLIRALISSEKLSADDISGVGVIRFNTNTQRFTVMDNGSTVWTSL